AADHVHQEVEAAQCLVCLCHRPFCLAAIGDVGLDWHGFIAVFGELRGHIIGPGAVEVHQGHVHADAGEQACGSATHSEAAAHDQGFLPGDTEEVVHVISC